MPTPKFKRVSEGLHRYEENGRVFTLTRSRDHLRRKKAWNLNRGKGWANQGCNSICIPSIVKGNEALRFITAIDEYMTRLGAVQCDRYDWLLITKVGLLHIGPEFEAVMCRFEDGDLARTLPSLNLSRYNSKWNFHYPAGLSPVTMFNDFKTHLECVLHEDRSGQTKDV